MHHFGTEPVAHYGTQHVAHHGTEHVAHGGTEHCAHDEQSHGEGGRALEGAHYETRALSYARDHQCRYDYGIVV